MPGVRKAVKWNSPFYGVEDERWFSAIHTHARYVQVAFFSRQARIESWVKQASKLPGWSP